MYLKMFGLNEKPFHITPNPRFIFLSKNHKEAFAHLLYGVRQRVGFLSLIGEVGTGKTTVLRTLLHQLEQSNHQVALIFNPCLSALELLHAIHREFSIPCAADEENLARLHDSLNNFLLEQRQQGRTVVLVIDEAQNLEPAVLEQLRLLSNLETETDKLLQLIIVGQPELDEVLERHELRQLKQRLVVRYRLTKMDAEDTAAYIHHRLKVAGHQGGALFNDKAVQLIFRLTQGLPRLINILCDRAMLVAYTHERNRIDYATVREAQNELSGQEPLQPVRWPRYLLLALLVAVTTVTLVFKPELLDSLFDPATQQTQQVQNPAPPEIAVPASLPIPPSPATETTEPDPLLSQRLKQMISNFSEADSGRLATSAVLERWGRPGLKELNLGVYRPIEAALRNRQISSIRFDGDREKLLDFDSPAILTIVLPNLKGKRYLALLRVRDDKVLTVPQLTDDGWFPLRYLTEIWFGKAVIPWNNIDALPYLDSPGRKHPGINRIQELLSIAGYPDLEISGIYDGATINAVSDLQKRTGLAPDGRVGAQTLLHLYRLVGLEMPSLKEEGI